ncbi:hypothetical protein B0H11DRAFT_1939640 [Mycena galericulata]|nr:hypothetical protein B0H11DRAFT_1939640 [Mycena galericulata]
MLGNLAWKGTRVDPRWVSKAETSFRSSYLQATRAVWIEISPICTSRSTKFAITCNFIGELSENIARIVVLKHTVPYVKRQHITYGPIGILAPVSGINRERLQRDEIEDGEKGRNTIDVVGSQCGWWDDSDVAKISSFDTQVWFGFREAMYCFATATSLAGNAFYSELDADLAYDAVGTKHYLLPRQKWLATLDAPGGKVASHPIHVGVGAAPRWRRPVLFPAASRKTPWSRGHDGGGVACPPTATTHSSSVHAPSGDVAVS